ncbi:MAG: hypothetical protein CL489_10530 [Acidobacteria bacterium]|nr:hypothetical protein [Acidobacteriota bacterium]
MENKFSELFASNYKMFIKHIQKQYFNSLDYKYEMSAKDYLHEAYIRFLTKIMTDQGMDLLKLSNQAVFCSYFKEVIKSVYLDHSRSTKSRLEREKSYSKAKPEYTELTSKLETVDFLVNMDTNDKVFIKMSMDGLKVEDMKSVLETNNRDFYLIKEGVEESLING